MIPILLTIGGSDSSGGAGIQADIKTFASQGAYGTSVITAVTAQNTLGVKDTFKLPPEAVVAQLETLKEDFNIDYVKTGMLCSTEITSIAADQIEDLCVPLVLDPVIEAEAGGTLLDRSAVEVMRKKLIPLARVVTPNIFEAEALSGVKVIDQETAQKAAEKILDFGAQAVIVTGGHLEGTDFLSGDGALFLILGDKVEGGNHGVGCTYSAALATFLARDYPIKEAAFAAKDVATTSISWSHFVGKGASPVNQMGKVLEDADRFQVLTEVDRAVNLLMSEPSFGLLVPEVGSNVGMAIEGAKDYLDVAAVQGRLVKSGRKAHQSGCVRFGSSKHVARIILAAMSFDPRERAAMNIRFSRSILDVCEDLNLKLASFNRKHEPSRAKTMSWGTSKAIAEAGFFPEAIWDEGGMGKEPMIRLLGSSPTQVVNRAMMIAEKLDESDGNL